MVVDPNPPPHLHRARVRVLRAERRAPPAARESAVSQSLSLQKPKSLLEYSKVLSCGVKTERPVWTGLSRLAEAFSLYWLPSSPRQPHSPLERILFKTAAGSTPPLQLFALFPAVKCPVDLSRASGPFVM